MVANIDQQIADYYRSLIPKWKNVSRGRWPAHITVVRITRDTPSNLDAWGKYEGESVEFLYSGEIHHDSTYFWINVWSKHLEDIRHELGLPNVSYTAPPGFLKNFHCTIANNKG